MTDFGRRYVFDLEAKLQSAEAELARLREERDPQFDNVIALSNQRDALLEAAAPFAAIDVGTRPDDWDLEGLVHGGRPDVADVKHLRRVIQDIARAAIAEVEGEP